MTTYGNTFNGNFVQPSSVSYNNIILNSNITLTWPTAYQDSSTNYVLASNMTVQAAEQAPLIINLGDNPLSTIDESNIVSVSVPSTSNFIVGSNITISGAQETNNITPEELNIFTPITGIVGGNIFTYVAGGTANATGTGGGNAVILNYSIPYVIILPDATQVSVGETVRFINNGENDFVVADNEQNFLISISDGNVYDLLLTDNTTSGGIWEILEAGTGTSEANASSLAGLGLTTLNGTLNTDFQSKSINGNYTAGLSDRSSLLIWTGGVGTITLPQVNNPAPKGYNVSVNNSGSGIVTVTTSDDTTIDGLEDFTLNPGESCQFILTTPNWNTLGFGTETFFAVNTLSLDISAGGTINLTTSQASRLVQTYTGALVQNTIITFPAAAGQWYVWNNTSNAFSVTLQLFGVGGGFIVPQGEKLIVYSDGTNLYFTPTTATNAIFNPGTEGSPTIVFTNDNTTGFYSVGTGDFGFSSEGTLSIDLASYGLGIKGGGQTRYYNGANTFYAGIKAGNMASNITWTLPLSDATTSGQILYSNAAATLGFTSAAYPMSTTINQLLYSSAANTITGLATANNGVLITGSTGIPAYLASVNNSVLTTSNTGIPTYLVSANNSILLTSNTGVPSLGSTLPVAVQNNISNLGTISSVGAPIGVPYGGTGINTLTTAYGVICAGTTATGPIQNAGVGTAGQVLTSNGAGALPSFQSTGELIFLNAVTAANQAFITFTNVFSATYDYYQITFTGVLPATNAVDFQYTLSANGINYISAGYQYGSYLNGSTIGGESGVNGGTNTASCVLTYPVNSYQVSNIAANGGVSGTLILCNPNSSTLGTLGYHSLSYGSFTSGYYIASTNGFSGLSAQTLTSIRFSFSSGNIASGTIRVYGVRKN